MIAGGGLAAQRAAETLRRTGYDGSLRIFAAEPELPYDRPPLSKEFLAGELDDRMLRFRADDWYADNSIDVLLGDPAAGLDAAERAVVLESGRRVPFGRLLIATGSAPRRLPGTTGFENVHELRTLADARRLRGALGAGSRLVVVGAGFIGQEVASTALRLGAEVTIVEAAPAPLASVLGTELGRWFARLHREEGIDVRLSARIARLHGRRTVTRGASSTTATGSPATRWSSASARPRHCVACRQRSRRRRRPRRRRRRHRRSPASTPPATPADRSTPSRASTSVPSTGRPPPATAPPLPARCSASPTLPASLPSFWSDQHGIRIQYLGHAHGADRIAIDGDPPARDFTATFTRHGRPIGALLVGRPHALAELRHRLATTPERTAA